MSKNFSFSEIEVSKTDDLSQCPFSKFTNALKCIKDSNLSENEKNDMSVLCKEYYQIEINKEILNKKILNNGFFIHEQFDKFKDISFSDLKHDNAEEIYFFVKQMILFLNNVNSNHDNIVFNYSSEFNNELKFSIQNDNDAESFMLTGRFDLNSKNRLNIRLQLIFILYRMLLSQDDCEKFFKLDKKSA